MRFFLGAHMPSWLAQLDYPLFVSHRRLARRRTFPRALAPWALDSGGYTELSLYGGWAESPATYAGHARRYMTEVGNLAWAAPQDWLCSPAILAKTHRSVDDHLRRTVANYLELRQLAPDVPWIPVLQGWALADYQACAAMYEGAGIDLAAEPTVGIGSIAARQGTGEVDRIVSLFAGNGLRLHAFGAKWGGLTRYSHVLESADSMAWSYNARRYPPLEGCSHLRCASCPRWATAWRTRLLEALEAPVQTTLAL